MFVQISLIMDNKILALLQITQEAGSRNKKAYNLH